MDPARYLDLFLAESRERLGASCSLHARLEEKPFERQALGELLRHAHSLKGMAATMGFTPVVELAHAMESLLERWQAGGADPGTAAPLVGDALSCLGELLDTIERDGATVSLPRPSVIESLSSAPGERPTAIERGPEVDAEPPLLPDSAPDAARLWKVDVTLEEDSTRSVRGVIGALRLLGRAGRLLHVDPPRVAAGTGRYDGRLGIVHESVLEPKRLSTELERVPGVTAVRVEALVALPARPAPPERSSWVRVRAEQLDAIADELSELQRSFTRLEVALAQGAHAPLLERAASHLRQAHGALDELRLVPFEIVRPRIERTVRALARELGKEVRLSITGAEARLERRVLDELIDPLLHLVRNALDHGIEPPEERRRLGKPAAGTLTLALASTRERVELRVSDDGRGIDLERVRLAAVERGLLDEASAPTIDARCVAELVMRPGFSTAETVTHISGRGIGMDVARDGVERLGGRVELHSEPGSGTEVRLSVPARRARIETLLVRSSGALFAVPVEQVQRVVACSDPAARSADLRRLETCHTRTNVEATHDGTWVVLAGREGTGFVVDEVLGTRECVVHPLPPPLDLLSRYVGAAALVDGSIALVVDPVLDGPVGLDERRLTRRGDARAGA